MYDAVGRNSGDVVTDAVYNRNIEWLTCNVKFSGLKAATFGTLRRSEGRLW